MKEDNKIKLAVNILPDDITNTGAVPTTLSIMTSKSLFIDDVEYTWTKENMAQLKDNFDKNVLKRKVPVIIEHGRTGKGTMAVGYITGLDIMTDDNGSELVASITWSEEGENLIKTGAYLYTSVGISLGYIDQADGKTNHGLVLEELSLTSIPADSNLKEIVRKFDKRTLREYSLCIKSKPEGINMSMNKENIMELDSLKTQVIEMASELKSTKDSISSIEKERDSFKKEAVELAKKLDVTNRAIELDSFIKEGKLTPAMKEDALKLSKESFDGFKLALSAAPKKVSTEPKGVGNSNSIEMSKTVKSSEDKEGYLLDKKIEELMKADKTLSFRAAASKALEAEPSLGNM